MNPTASRNALTTALASLLVAWLCGAAGCGPADHNKIRIGEFASLTGKEATFGQSSHEGTLMAIDEINQAGGVFGKQLELITEDTQSKLGESATVVNKLISREGVIAVLGEVASTRSIEAATVCQESRIPMISPSSTNPKVTETGDYIFRVCFIDPFQGAVMADFARKSLKLRKVAVFTDAKSDYSKGLAQFFKQRFTQNGGAISVELDYNGGDKIFSSQLTAIKAAGPDGVFIPGYYTDVALICIQARELGLTLPLFGGDGWESEDLVKIGKGAVEGTYFSTHYHPDVSTATSRKFVANYKARFKSADGSPKTPDALAANGYDSALILVDALKRAGTTDAAKLRDALAATKNFEAVTGRITINEKRDASKSAVILQVKDGGYKFLETISP